MGRPLTVTQMLPRLRHILYRFWPYVQKQRILVSGSLLALLAEVGLRILEPWPLKFVFDYVIGPEIAETEPSRILSEVDPMTVLIGAALAQVGVTGLRALTSYYSTVGFALVGQRVLAEVRGLVYRHLQYLSLGFHNQARSGDLVVRVIGDIGMLREAVVTAFLPLLAKILILIAMLALMFWFSWFLTLVALIPLPLFWLRTVRLTRRLHQVAKVQRQRQGAMAATAAESFGAIRTVQALSLEDNFADAFVSESKKSVKEGAKAKRLAAGLERSSDLILAISTALVLVFGVRMILTHQLTPGDLLVFLYYVKHAFRPIRDFARYTGRMAKATAAGERVLDVLEQTPDVHDLPGSVAAQAFQGSIEFRCVSFEYKDGDKALQKIDLNLSPGEMLALTGPSGGGKSTLASLVLRLYDPTEGVVLIDGKDIRTYTLESVRSQISTVLQDNLLFAGTIRENIALGRANTTDEEIIAAARLAQAHQFIVKLPQGYETPVGERGVTLSHGQRQRIALARAAIRQAPILLLDEPTTALDDDNARRVSKAIGSLSTTSTTILITHDLRLASTADRILYLENGRLLECGTHQTLKAAGGRYSSLLKELEKTWKHPQEVEA